MRSWHPIHPRHLDNQHLNGEHHELHTMFSVITNGTKGWSTHPETKRWVGRLRALVRRHDIVAEEMIKRGMNHRSPLEADSGSRVLPPPYQPISEMWRVLREKQAS